MYKQILNKKDIIAFNQGIGERGEFNNEGSLDFALSIAKTKQNWLYELSYLIRSLLVDHVFRDGNKRTCLLVIAYFFEENGKVFHSDQLIKTIRKIAAKNIINPVIIMRLINNVIREKN